MEVCWGKWKSSVYEDALALRFLIFQDEQEFHEREDEHDPEALHIVLYDEDLPVATARLISVDKKTGQVGRFCVRKDYRKAKVGSYLMEILEDEAKKLGKEKLVLGAQCRARNFYESVGFVSEGDLYFEEYCEHTHMVKNLEKKEPLPS